MWLADSFVVVTFSHALDVRIDTLPSTLQVVALQGRESLGALFEIELTTCADDDLLGQVDVVGRRVRLRLDVAGRTRTIHGMIRTLEHGDAPGLQRVVVVPVAYVLALREDCRIFQGRRAPDIIESVLVNAGLSPRDYRLDLAEVYQPREHTTQYRESDWTFLTRLLETEGIHCYVEHADERAVLVFADAPGSHRSIEAPEQLPYRPGDGAGRGGEHVASFVFARELHAGRVTLRGRSFHSPGAPLEGHAAVEDAGLGIYDAPPDLDVPGAADRMARMRLEREVARSGVARGTSDCPGLAPGLVFALRGHPREGLDREWLVTSVQHGVVADEGGQTRYQNRFTCIPADVPYRPAARTPKPTLGVQTAVVVGPPGQEVHCDDLGRVKVRFHWDRQRDSDEHISSWLRVSQAWAGPGYGALFVPRVGHEVLVDFAGGDPDRPIVVGSLYHASNLPPASLPRHRTATVLRTASSIDGEGVSELVMDSQKGLEQVRLAAWRDLEVRVGGSKDEEIRRDEHLDVGGDRERRVAGSEKVDIEGSHRVAVGGTRVATVGRHESVSIADSQELGIGGDRKVEVQGSVTEVVGRGLTIRVGGDRREAVTGRNELTVDGDHAERARRQTIDVAERLRVDVGGEHEERCATRRLHAAESVEIVCGESRIVALADGTIRLLGHRLRLEASGPIEIDGRKLSVTSSGNVSVRAGGTVKVRGPGIHMN